MKKGITNIMHGIGAAIFIGIIALLLWLLIEKAKDMQTIIALSALCVLFILMTLGLTRRFLPAKRVIAKIVAKRILETQGYGMKTGKRLYGKTDVVDALINGKMRTLSFIDTNDFYSLKEGGEYILLLKGTEVFGIKKVL